MDQHPVAAADVLRVPDLDGMDMGFDAFRSDLRRAIRRQTWIVCGVVLAAFSLSRVISGLG